MRWLAALLCIAVACKKKEQVEPEPPAKPSIGHSVTTLKSAEPPQGSGSGSEAGSDAGSAAGSGSVVADTPADAAEAPDAQLYGGNGQPPHLDKTGHVRGPGGPIFGGRGPDCTDAIDHCLRDGVWFAVAKITPGKLFRATPVFEYEGKWYNWYGRDESVTTVYKTKVATASALKAGNPVIWLIEEPSSPKWHTNEYESLTSTRWEAGIIERVSGNKFTVKGWSAPVPVETARVLTQSRGG